MGAYVKKSQSAWAPIQKIYVKVNPTGSGAWKLVKQIYTKITPSSWILFWPKIGPFATITPYFSTDSGGGYAIPDYKVVGSDVVGYRRIGQSLYGQNATWTSNNYTISGYQWSLQGWTAYNGGSKTDTFFTGTSFPKSISLSTPGFDGFTTTSQYAGKFLTFSVVANTTTSGVTGSSASDDFITDGTGGTKLAIIQYQPSIQGAQTSGTAGIKLGDTIYYYGTWDGRESYCPDYTRSLISLYKSTTDFGPSWTLSTLINGGATFVKTELGYGGLTSFSGDGTTFNVSTYYTTATGDENCFFYFIDTQTNSGSFIGNSVSNQYAKSNQVLSPPQVVIAPTITCTTPSGYGGNQNSFTVGGQVTVNTGQWSPTPSGTYAISWLTLWGSSSSLNISNGYQTNYNQLWEYTYAGGGLYSSYKDGGFDTSQNQNHYFYIKNPSYTGANGSGGSSPVGKYFSLETVAKVGTSSPSIAYYNTPTQIYDVPYAAQISMTSTAQNAASVTFQSTGSYYYQLQYSANGSTGWTDIGFPKYISTLNIIGYTASYSSLPSGYNYYRAVSYNADGVTIAGSYVYFNSTPPPSTPTFTYDYGVNALYNGTITATANGATSMSATVYRSSASTWGSTTTYDTAASYGTNKLYYSIPSTAYYYIYVTATNAYGSTSAYSILNNTTIFYAGIPIGTSAQSVSASTTALQIDLSWTPANWQTFAPYTGDNITYTNNNSSYEIYRSTSSSTPATSVTPTYTGLSPSSYSDTTGLLGATRYYYWIRGRNNNTFGGWVSMGNALTYTPPNPQAFTTISGTKAYPTGATQTASEPTQSRVLSTSWNASTNATYYEVQYEGSNDNATWTILQSFAQSSLITATSNSYTAIYKRYYRFAVRATPSPYSITNAAYSDYGTSGSLQYYYITGTSPTAPTIGTITLGTGASYSSVTVNYAFPTNPGSNTIDFNYWSTDNVNFTSVYATSFTIGSLSASTAYTVYMKSKNYDGLYSSTSSKTFTTNAAPVYYTVTFNGNGGTPSSTSVTQSTVGGSITAPAAPTQTSYTFNGWYNASSGGSLIVGASGSYTPTSNIQLYAQWTYVSPTYAPNIPSYTASSSGTSTTTAKLNFTVNITAPTVDGSHSAATSYTLYVQAGTSSSGPFSNASTTITTTGGSGSGTSASPHTTSGTPASVSGYFQVTGNYTWVRAYVKANNSGGSSSYGSGAVG